MCRGRDQSILYAWARDAPALELPKGVGFKVGGESPIQYLILQVHYMHALPGAFAQLVIFSNTRCISEPDHSGITIHSTNIPMPRSAGVMLLATNGMIQSHTTGITSACVQCSLVYYYADNFDVACVVDERRAALHPFAFRVHAHTRGKVVSGWKVERIVLVNTHNTLPGEQ